MKLKYIMVEVDKMEVPLVFPTLLSHGDISIMGKVNLKSAGYCEIADTGEWIASGQSVSLQLAARPQDAKILNTELGARARYLAQLNTK